MQAEPIKSTLKASGSECLKLECDGMLSNFAFKTKLRHYSEGSNGAGGDHVHAWRWLRNPERAAEAGPYMFPLFSST